MYILYMNCQGTFKEYLFSSADSALQFARHIRAKEEAYYNCGKPTYIAIHRLLPIDNLAPCANAIEKEMWNDPDYFLNMFSESLAEWSIV